MNYTYRQYKKKKREHEQKVKQARKRLEKAAPELLQACEMVLPLVEGEVITYKCLPPDNDLSKSLFADYLKAEKVLRAAIAKAKP